MTNYVFLVYAVGFKEASGPQLPTVVCTGGESLRTNINRIFLRQAKLEIWKLALDGYNTPTLAFEGTREEFMNLKNI